MQPRTPTTTAPRKRAKPIFVQFFEDEFEQIKAAADADRRPLASFVQLLAIEAMAARTVSAPADLRRSA